MKACKAALISSNLFWLLVYFGSAWALWNLPIAPVETFMGNRLKYEKSFSLLEIDQTFLRANDPSVVINFEALQMRFLFFWIVGLILAVGLFVGLRNGLQKRKREKPDAE